MVLKEAYLIAVVRTLTAVERISLCIHAINHIVFGAVCLHFSLQFVFQLSNC